jgi:ATP-dependent RNA helicase RhlE
VAPEEEPELRTIERAVGRQLPRVIVPDFDYTAGPDAALEVPIADRIAAIRTRKAEGRARAGINADRLAAAAARTAASPTPRPPTGRRSA